MKSFRLFSVLLGLVLLAGAAGGYLWWSKPEHRLARLQKSAREAVKTKDKHRMKIVLQRLDDFVTERQGKPPEKLETGARMEALDLVRRGLKDSKDLLRRIGEFLKRHPKHPDADKLLLEQVELMEKAEKKPLRAIRLIEARLARKPEPKDEDLGELLFKLGKLNDAIGEYDEAADAYQQLVDDLPSHPKANEALFRLGEIYANRLDREDKAKEAYEKLAKKDPNSELGREAKERAKGLKEFEGSDTGAAEQQQITTFIQQSGDELMKEIMNEKKEIRWLRTRVRMGKLSLQVSGSMGVRALGPLKDKIRFIYNHQFKVLNLLVDGKTRKPKGGDMVLEVPLQQPLIKGQEITISWKASLGLKARDKMGKMNKPGPVMVGGMGMVSTKEGYLTASDFWYPALDYDSQIRLETEVDFPAPLVALAAGEIVRESTKGGRYKALWKLPQRHGHNSLCYGEFVKETDGAFSAYVHRGKARLAGPILKRAKASHAFFSSIFGPSKYDNLKICQIESPFFKGYAEATLVMLGGREASRVSGTGVLAHEVAHQWWGNQVPISVTKGTQPWLWEGFASYSDVLFHEHEKGTAAGRLRLKMMATRFFHDMLRHGDVAIKENSIVHPGYLGVVYQKGAWVLHMLRGQMGESVFKRSMSGYVKAQTDKAVTVPAFNASLKNASGKSWDGFLKEWLDRPGYVRAGLSDITQAASGALSGELEQGDPAYTLTVMLEAKNKGPGKRFSVPLSGHRAPLNEKLPFQGGVLEVDPDDWLFKEPGNRPSAPIRTGVP